MPKSLNVDMINFMDQIFVVCIYPTALSRFRENIKPTWSTLSECEMNVNGFISLDPHFAQ